MNGRSTSVDIRFESWIFACSAPSFSLARTKLEEVARPVVSKTEQTIRRVINDAKLTPEQVDKVILGRASLDAEHLVVVLRGHGGYPLLSFVNNSVVGVADFLVAALATRGGPLLLFLSLLLIDRGPYLLEDPLQRLAPLPDRSGVLPTDRLPEVLSRRA